MNRDKNKAESSKGYNPHIHASYRSAFEKDEKTLKEEALKAVPEENKLREDAYKIAVKSASVKEYVYPYIKVILSSLKLFHGIKLSFQKNGFLRKEIDL